MDKKQIIQFVNDNGLRIGELAREGNYDAARLMKDYSIWFRAHGPKQSTESRLDSKETQDVEMAIVGGIAVLTPLLAVPEPTEDEDSAPVA